MKLIQDITEGEEISHQITITFRLYQQFMDLSGDTSPIHSNKNFAQAHGFKDVLGYAFLLTALLSKIYGTIFPGGSELCLQQECNFPKPYYINDTLTFKIKVLNKNESLKLLTVMTTIEDQQEQLIFKGKAVFQLSLNKNLEENYGSL